MNSFFVKAMLTIMGNIIGFFILDYFGIKPTWIAVVMSFILGMGLSYLLDFLGGKM